MARRGKGSLTRVGKIARGVLGDRLWEKAQNRELLRRVWREVVGDFVAKHSEVGGIRGDALLVKVDDHSLMNNLQLMSPGILRRINDEVKGKIGPFRRLILRWDTIEREDEPKPEMSSEPEITPEQRARIEEVVKDIEDPELKEITRRVLARSLAREASKE